MPPLVALILCVVLVIVLLRIDCRRNPEASGALWVPIIWLLLSGSKPLGRWFESGAFAAEVSEEGGSPLDRLVLIILIMFALLFIHKRKIEWSRVLQDNFWLTLLFLYLGVSILWSDFPFISFKRWIRVLGTIPIAMVVLSERSPFSALEIVFRRCAYILIPMSLLLIKYYPYLGVAYVSWTGDKMWVGVANQKNGLGVICAFSVFLFIWSFYRELRAGALLKGRTHLFADGLVLVIAAYLLRGFQGIYSATAIGFVLTGIASMLLLYWMKNKVRTIATVLVLTVAIVLLCLHFATSLVSTVTSAFNRNPTFTGRTDIWNAVLDVASSNPVLGVGYGGYWGLKDEMIRSKFLVSESHSGYLDIYLESGIVGMLLFIMFLMAYFRKALRVLNHVNDWGVFGICLLIMSMIHGFTESNFLRSSYLWTSIVFVTVVFSASSLQKRKAD